MRVMVWSNSSASGVSRVIVMSVVAGARAVAQPDAALGEGFFLVGEGAVGVEVEPGLVRRGGRLGPDRSCAG